MIFITKSFLLKKIHPNCTDASEKWSTKDYIRGWLMPGLIMVLCITPYIRVVEIAGSPRSLPNKIIQNLKISFWQIEKYS
jgi:hypothetical protein